MPLISPCMWACVWAYESGRPGLKGCPENMAQILGLSAGSLLGPALVMSPDKDFSEQEFQVFSIQEARAMPLPCSHSCPAGLGWGSPSLQLLASSSSL